MNHDRDRQARRTRATRTAVITLGTVGALGAAGAIGVGIAESQAQRASSRVSTPTSTNNGAGQDENRRQDNGFVPTKQQTQQARPTRHHTQQQTPLASPGNGGSSQGSSSGS